MPRREAPPAASVLEKETAANAAYSDKVRMLFQEIFLSKLQLIEKL